MSEVKAQRGALTDPMGGRQSPPDTFHSQHAPLGAFASFTLGLVGSQGGFGQSLRGPARQNIYVGFRRAGLGGADRAEATWRLLPFFTPPQSNEVAFTGEAATAQPPRRVRVLAPEEYQRTLGWASDTWRADDERFGFCLLSPFSKLADPSTMTKAVARTSLSPHINGWIELDNSQGGEPAEIVFGVGETDRLFRPLQDTDTSLLGFAAGPDFGYATSAGPGVESRQGFDVFDPKFEDFRGLHLIGGESALIFTVPAGRKKRFPLVLGFFQSGVATTGITARYAYTRYFRDLEDVLGHGLVHRVAYEKEAARRDRELLRAKLDDDQRFLIAQATHSYLGNSQLLWDKSGPLWVVNEGEYRMMNTFDLTVDHLFFELEFMPWAVRNVLDLFVKRYAYTDKINVGGRALAGGISFTHDMGVMNNFTPPGHSSYECDHLHGCFSHMTMEQLLNWVITAVVYAESAGDGAWLRRQRKTLAACAESLHRRDNPVPGERDGILKFDSLRCGLDGAEITTYDSLDVSLGQARNNLYLSIKTLAAWVLLERAFLRLGMKHASQDARSTAELLAASIGTKFDDASGTFPAVFEADNQSRIIPAIEGFVYPLFLELNEACDRRGRFGELMEKLSRHLSAILRPGVCLDAESGAWKMSSTSHNTWFSKIAIAQHVVRKLFPEAMSPEARAGDRVHAQWQRQVGCGANAMCDQIHSTTGVACGSRYYPRGVTSLLWLRE